VAAYAVCEQAGTCSRVHRGINCNNPEYPVRVNHPRNCVTWPQAHTYCEAQGLRLPTEAEWERAPVATRAGCTPWGNEPPSPQHARWEPSDPGRAYRIDGDWGHDRPRGLPTPWAAPPRACTTSPATSVSGWPIGMPTIRPNLR
jgi:formylglycine-generating enzyme required for sulfatase activity